MTKGKNYLNPLQVKDHLRYVIKNNLRLAGEGKVPIAMEVEGGPGTAKTSVAKQLSEEFDHHYQRLNLAEIEVPDLIGLPTYEYQITKGKEEKWISDKLIAYFCNASLGWEPSGEVRTSYAKPIWIHGKEDKPIILVLDDYNRVTPMMANACMTLIDEQKYISWSLPKGSTIILTCNPSDEDFMVQQEDSAQATRRLKLHMKASVQVWASEFAEKYGVDGRCINFLLKHPEVIEGAVNSDKKNKNNDVEDGIKLAKGNLRIWTKYFDSISGLSDFKSNQEILMDLGMGSLPSEHVMMFVKFINDGYDKLPAPEHLLTTKEDVMKIFKDVIGEGKERRQDIASIITTRLMNYSVAREDTFTADMVKRYGDMLESGYLTPDLCIITVRKLCRYSAFKTLAIRPKLMKMLAG